MRHKAVVDLGGGGIRCGRGGGGERKGYRGTGSSPPPPWGPRRPAWAFRGGYETCSGGYEIHAVLRDTSL